MKGNCFLCGKDAFVTFITDKGIALYICYSCYKFNNKNFRKLNNDSNLESDVVYNVTKFLTRHINNLEIIKSKIKHHFSESFPWDEVVKNAKKYQQMFPIKRYGAPPKHRLKKREWFKIDIPKTIPIKVISKEDKIYNQLSQLDSPNKFDSELLFGNMELFLKSSKSPNGEDFRIFELLHRKINGHFTGIIAINLELAKKIIQEFEPLYNGLKYNLYYDKYNNQYSEWKSILKKYEEKAAAKKRYIKLIDDITSGLDIKRSLDDILKGFHFLEESARAGDFKPNKYKLFKSFHNKIVQYHSQLLDISINTAIKLIVSTKPLYEDIIYIENGNLDKRLWNEYQEIKNKAKLRLAEIKGIRKEKSLKIIGAKEKDNIKVESTELIKTNLPKEPEIIEINDILNFFQEHAWREINNRKRGLPGGDWYGEIENPKLNEYGYDYYTIWEKRAVYHCQVWKEKQKKNAYNFSFVDGAKFPNSLLYTYILCSLADILSDRQKHSSNGRMARKKEVFRSASKEKTVYYPLTRLSINSNPKSGSKQVISDRSAYFVSWHLRKLRVGSTASPAAQERALLIGGINNIPKGYTFIPPHWRGNVKDDSVKKVVTNLLTNSLSLTIESLLRSKK